MEKKSLVGYSPWCRRKLNMTERLTLDFSLLFISVCLVLSSACQCMKVKDSCQNCLKLFLIFWCCYSIQLKQSIGWECGENYHLPLFTVYRMKRNRLSFMNKVLQASPTVKQPKLGCFSSLSQTHMCAVLLDWGNLPHHVVLRVFQYLPLIDRARASSVCRRWNEVFHIPDLWRKFEFELNQSATSYFNSTHPDLIQQIIKKRAAHLQYVSFKVRKISST